MKVYFKANSGCLYRKECRRFYTHVCIGGSLDLRLPRPRPGQSETFTITNKQTSEKQAYPQKQVHSEAVNAQNRNGTHSHGQIPLCTFTKRH